MWNCLTALLHTKRKNQLLELWSETGGWGWREREEIDERKGVEKVTISASSHEKCRGDASIDARNSLVHSAARECGG